jgi:hypothetical protein
VNHVKAWLISKTNSSKKSRSGDSHNFLEAELTLCEEVG